jgi:hypothetical protein
MNFTYKKISIEQAIALLAKNGIKVDDEEIAVILDLLYLISKNYKKTEKNSITLRRFRICEKSYRKYIEALLDNFKQVIEEF